MAGSEKMALASHYRSELGSITAFLERLCTRLAGRSSIDHETEALIQENVINRLKTLHSKVHGFVESKGLKAPDPALSASLDGHLAAVLSQLEDLKRGGSLRNPSWPNLLLSALRDYQMSLEILMRNL